MTNVLADAVAVEAARHGLVLVPVEVIDLASGAVVSSHLDLHDGDGVVERQVGLVELGLFLGVVEVRPSCGAVAAA